MDSIQRVTGTLAAGAHPGSYNGQDAYKDMLIPFVKSRRAQSVEDAETWETGRPAPTINQFDSGETRATTVIAFDSAFGGQSNTFQNISPPVKVGSGVGIPSPPAVAQPNLAVRRLTPLECERLMGWPDNHTLHRADGKPASDSNRYKQCGNGVVAPVAQWIAKHLKPLL